MDGVLTGIRIVELTEALAGPYCAQLLGDMGADVIKVERPGSGDQSRAWGPPFIGTESAYFLATNRNKRSITLDFTDPRGMEVLLRLIATADVFLCNLPSIESLQRRGLDEATLRDKHPRLIYCSITGYGFSGPKTGRPGYDILAQAEAGVMSFTGGPGSEPTRFPIAIADITTGIYSAMGILGALYARERSGQGEFLDMALFDSQISWLANVGSNYLNIGVSPERWGNAHPSIVPYQTFRGGDGEPFVVAVGTPLVWRKLARALDMDEAMANDPRYASNASRVQNRAELVDFLQKRFAELPAKHWLVRLTDAGVPAAAIQTVGEALSDPQSLARGLIVEMEHPDLQKVRSIANPIRFRDQAIVYRLPPPRLGEHTQEILCELTKANARTR